MLLLLLCANLFLSCQKPPQQALTVHVEHPDGELLLIAEEARRALPVFFRHLSRAEAGGESFAIKYPFKANDGSGIAREQVWLTGIHFKDGLYHGILASEPLHLDGMKRGSTVTFDVDEITDWMFVQDGKIVGGRSVKYLLEQIPDNQRTGEQRRLLQMFDE
jgi:uncharacterized protein YegJ (DUF2314 family)